MNYKTYAEAKIANPDSEIVTTAKNWKGGKDLLGTFEAITGSNGSHIIDDISWVICNPADHCSSIKEFLEAGFKFSIGDWFLGDSGDVLLIEEIYPKTSDIEPYDDKRYILSASALNGGCKIPDKAEQWTIYNNTLPLCELTDEQYGKMRRMHDAGMGVEWRSSAIGRWELLSTPTWNPSGIYRIKSKSERELFIDKSIKLVTPENYESMNKMFGTQFDAGARYKDLTQHFGENI